MERILSNNILNYISQYDTSDERFESTIPRTPIELESTSSYFYFENFNDAKCSNQFTYAIGYPTSKCLILYSAADIAVGSVMGSCSGIWTSYEAIIEHDCHHTNTYS